MQGTFDCNSVSGSSRGTIKKLRCCIVVEKERPGATRLRIEGSLEDKEECKMQVCQGSECTSVQDKPLLVFLRHPPHHPRSPVTCRMASSDQLPNEVGRIICIVWRMPQVPSNLQQAYWPVLVGRKWQRRTGSTSRITSTSSHF